MKDTTKTIIIGILITILVLALTIFILYKIDSKKLNNENSTNKNEYNNSIPASNTNNNESNSNNTINNNDNNEANTTIKDDEKDEKVILYLFHGATCPACNNALKTIKEERNTTFKNIEIRTYEIYNNESNKSLYNLLANKFKLERKAIPYFIIGDYNRVGFNSETLLKEYKNALNNKNYKDIVEEVIKKNPNLKPVYETI